MPTAHNPDLESQLAQWPTYTHSSHAQLAALRQSVVLRFIEAYKYPADWLNRRIQPVESEKWLGFTVQTHWKQTFIVVAITQPSHLTSLSHQLHQQYPSAEVIQLWTHEDEHAGCIYKHAHHTAHTKIDLRPYDTKQGLLVSTPVERNQKVDDLSEFLHELHSMIRDMDGLHADAALDELCKMVYLKRANEKGHLKPLELYTHPYGSLEECAAHIRYAYRVLTEHPHRRGKRNVLESMNRAFTQPIQLTSTTLVHIFKQMYGKCLSCTKDDWKGRVFQRILHPMLRAHMGQYFTPEKVVSCMVELLAPTAQERILDPFCGAGRLLSECGHYIHTHEPQTAHSLQLYGIEKNERMVRITATEMFLRAHNTYSVHCSDALLDFENYPDWAPHSFDMILTNPPFGAQLHHTAFAQLGHFELIRSNGYTPLEVVGLERCLQWLKPGGRMGIILPDGVLSNQRMEYVRSWWSQHAKICAIISLPVSTFSSFGACVKTSLVLTRTWNSTTDQQAHGEDYPVFMAHVDDVGYDATGRVTTSTELEDVRQAFLSFIEQNGW